MSTEASQVPLTELLRAVPADARILVDDADGKGTRNHPVGALCLQAAQVIESEGDALTQCIQERDSYHEWADKLAAAISAHFGVDIGEHSSANNPWREALEAFPAAAAPAGGAEPVATSAGWMLVLVNEGFGGLIDGLERAHRKGYMPDAIAEAYEGFDYRAAAPTAQLQPAGLSPLQESKYTVNGHAIVNRASGEEIPADEPVFIFRARDKWAAGVLGDYATFVEDPAHKAAVEERFIQFGEWAEAHPERMKEPDTQPSQPTLLNGLTEQETAASASVAGLSGAQPGVVLFDSRPQNQRIAEAEERMRNPAPLQWEDGEGPAQSERLPYVSALDPELRGGVPAEPSTFEDVEQKIVARYRVESKHSGYWGYCVKAGAGNMELFSGHRKQCDLVAAALQTACLDGAFMARTAQPEAPAEPSLLPLPHPGLPEVSAALDAVLAEYNYPANPKNAARAGWVAATRWLSNHTAHQPAELTDAQIDAAAADETGFDVADPGSLQAMSLEEIRRIVRSAIKAQGGRQ